MMRMSMLIMRKQLFNFRISSQEDKTNFSIKKQKLRVPFFGRHKQKKRNLPPRVVHHPRNPSKNTSKISTASSKYSNPTDLSMLQIAGSNVGQRAQGPKKAYKPQR
jgi:hypothetical protein